MVLNQQIIDNHQQLAAYSCIPMTVELILKLHGRASSNYFDLQTEWNNFKLGSFCNFDGKTINGVTFHHGFSVANGRNFPVEKLEELFAAIDRELDAAHYIAVSLQSGNDYHNFLIYDRDVCGEYVAVSKDGSRTCWEFKRPTENNRYDWNGHPDVRIVIS